MSKNEISVPFNDLLRIHKPLIPQFNECLTSAIQSSNFVNGQIVSEFENNLAKAEGLNFAASTSTGTSAIELTLKALGIGPGDEVVTTSFTFVATVFSILQVGAVPVLVDINGNDCLIDPDTITKSISKKTKAIIVVSLHGRLDHVNLYEDIAKRYGLYLILDASQSHLARWNSNNQGKYFDAMTLSFYPGKNLGSLGEGGAVLSDNSKIIEMVRIMRDWGSKQKYVHDYWGGNYRMQSIQAGFLNIKLPYLSEWTIERKKIAQKYISSLNPEILRSPVSQNGDNVYHIFDILVKNREKVIAHLVEQKISTGIHYPSIVQDNNAYRDKIKQLSPCENAKKLANTTLSLPLFPGLTDEELETVIDAINSYYD